MTHRRELNMKLIPKFLTSLFLATAMTVAWASECPAEEKSWNGAAEKHDWFEDENWVPAPAPTAVDDALINSTDASVTLSETFRTRSITLGGNENSVLMSEEFISGVVDPGSSSEVAVLNRRRGRLVLKGAMGTVKLKGRYKDSEESLAAQPSFVISIQ